MMYSERIGLAAEIAEAAVNLIAVENGPGREAAMADLAKMAAAIDCVLIQSPGAIGISFMGPKEDKKPAAPPEYKTIYLIEGERGGNDKGLMMLPCPCGCGKDPVCEDQTEAVIGFESFMRGCAPNPKGPGTIFRLVKFERRETVMERAL
jgi:hypothetical protein